MNWAKFHFLWPPLFLSLAISGAITLNIWPLYIMVIAMCICVGLIAFDKIPHKLYLPIIFSMSLALLYQTTLMSPGLVGTDVHADHYFAYWTLSTGTWHWQFPEAYNTSISTTLIAPFISWAFHIPLVWIFKVIYPFLLALVPPVLYFLYKERISKQVAFLSCFFFVAIPTYMVELTGIPKQQVAEFFFVIVAFLLLSERLRLKWKPLWMGLAALMFALCHYSIFAIGTGYLLGATVILLGLRLIWRKANLGIHLKPLLIITVITILAGTVYFSTVADGRVWNSFTGTYSSMAQRINPPDSPDTKSVVTPIPTPVSTPTVSPVTPTPKPCTTKDKPFYLWRQGPIVKAALGLDFLDVSTTGKLFRILQFMTQALIVLGIYRVVRNKGRQWNKAYLAFGVMACTILAMTVFYPSFAPVMNATRFYHLALIFLAPTAIIGGIWLFKRIGGVRTFTLAILIPYFLFTSGFIFEATKDTTTEILDTPYTIAMSGNRVEVGGVMTANDAKVRDFIVAGNYYPVYADIYGDYLIFEKMDSLEHVKEIFVYQKDLASKEIYSSYIFLRERNIEHQELTYWLGVGTRTTRSFEETGFDIMMEGREVIYQCGNAILLSPQLP